jgi:hypothetical protein
VNVGGLDRSIILGQRYGETKGENVKLGWVLVVTLASALLGPAAAAAADPRAEIAAALYDASVTQAASDKSVDAQLTAQRAQIAQLAK